MYLHGCDQAGIVGGFTGDGVPYDESFPGRVDIRIFWQKDKSSFDPVQFHRCFSWGQAKAVLLERSRSHRPKFDEVLRNDMKIAACLC